MRVGAGGLPCALTELEGPECVCRAEWQREVGSAAPPGGPALPPAGAAAPCAHGGPGARPLPAFLMLLAPWGLGPALSTSTPPGPWAASLASSCRCTLALHTPPLPRG